MLLHAGELVEQDVARKMRGLIVVVHQNTLDPQPAAGGRGDRAQVGVLLSGGDHHIAALRLCLAQQVFKRTDLVAAGADAVEVVALDVERAGIQLPLQTRQTVHRGSKIAQPAARKGCQGSFQFDSCHMRTP